MARAVEDAELPRSNPDIVYDLVGDIIFVRVCSLFMKLWILIHCCHFQLIPAPAAEPFYLLWVHIVGTVSGTLEKDMFDINAAQYTAALKNRLAVSRKIHHTTNSRNLFLTSIAQSPI